MKICLDENISKRVAGAVISITASRPGYEVSHVRQHHGPGTSDPDWLTKFSIADGTAIVSGDHRILRHWPNLIAYKATGLISFFPPPPYEKISGFGKAAYWIRWWPAVVEKVKISEKGDRWKLPMNWVNIAHTSMTLLRDPRVDNINEPKEQKPTAEIHRLSPRSRR